MSSEPLSGDGLGDVFGEQLQKERGLLHKSFARLDVIFFLICTLVGLDTIGTVAADGFQGITWMAILAVIFFIPYGLLVAELGTTFPMEGGPYVWTRLAFGRLIAGVNQMFYWLSNPIWIGGTLCLTGIATFSTFIAPLDGAWKYIAGLIFIWVAHITVIADANKGKWMPTAGALARIVLLGLFTLSAIIFGFQHGLNGLSAGGLKPSYIGFITLVPVLTFNFQGFELPTTASDEMKNPKRDIPVAILRSGAAACVLYGVPILLILMVMPKGDIGSLTGLIEAAKVVFTVWGGHVNHNGTAALSGLGSVFGTLAAIGMIVGVLTSGTAWAMGAYRAQAVACADGAGPAWLGKFNAKTGTPVRVTIVSGIVASAFMILALAITSGSAEKYFSAALGLAISMTSFSYVITFPALLVLRKRMGTVERPYTIPGGNFGATLVTGLTTFLVALTVADLIWPGLGVGWFGTSGTMNAELPSGFAGQRLQYTLSQVIPLLITVVIGVAFYYMGSSTRRAAEVTEQEAAVGLVDPEPGADVASSVRT